MGPEFATSRDRFAAGVEACRRLWSETDDSSGPVDPSCIVPTNPLPGARNVFIGAPSGARGAGR